ncbi:probable LRR receptor-like serine/threonine-protein kinase At3g47570 isoform X2 [Prosopis cineraria]|uniref:probable LRR receptor-like serine/threonine-protein kinase At3g47570 isoform X2 n=1 Tax=Prosopis cineraria TaxID=364024 RepID=UPI0024102202|nr:probable LRR receptor-like serine/threonine-protein kinase At3g47570 isoform X2 [Prosopis cineraria]
MKPSFVMFLAILPICLRFFLFFAFIIPPCKAISSLGNDTDHLSLLKFKESISDDPHHILDSWNATAHFCNWHGVTCGHKHHRVIELRLNGYGLRGSITRHIGNLSFLRVIVLDNNMFHGEIPQELGRLFRLQTLFISNNTLSEKFPVNITNCSQLRNLSFGGNNLTGKIPMEIGYLHKLERLLLPKNNLSGKIPMSMWNLSSLAFLSLAGNNLEGSIPEEIGILQKLRFFTVGDNKLSATMFINLPNLQYMDLEGNQFSGPVPTSIVNATTLAQISIGGNNFVGQIPNLGKLRDLYFLEFAYNSMGSNSSKDWEFLTSLSNCSKLNVLAFSQNNFGGHLPNTIGNLSTQLTSLYLSYNQISGKIPAAFGNLVNLTFLEMDMNYFTDIIPITFGEFQQMQYLSLSGNQFSGEITHFIGNLTRLFHLDLSNNELEGQVPPSIGNCESLQYLDMSQNNFNGAIPVQMISLSSLSILLNLSYNSFSDDLPEEVGKLTNIGQLDVSHNRLYGNIPQSIGDCQSLEYLLLQGNFFQETIPLSLASLKGLRYLDLSQNNLSGSIPKGIQDITSLTYLNVSFNMLEGEVPNEGVFGNASAISLMGNNKFCGGISKLGLPPCPLKSVGERKHPNFKMIVSVSGVTAFLLLLSIVAIYHLRKRSNKYSSDSPSIDMLSKVSYQKLHNATDGFSINHLIGSGSVGSVYKCRLESEEVAIKVINLQIRGAQKSFVAECNALKNTRHRNLVKILTCCSSIDYKGLEFKALVYEYMVNGSLEKWLHPNKTENAEYNPRNLLLDQILNVLVDVSSALHYLHYECEQPLVHCDIKPSNILLDGNMVAHLSDFGIARLLSIAEGNSNKQSSTIGIKGTFGYVPPEYGMGFEVSRQGDMYSFGILVLETLTGRRPMENMFKDGQNIHEYVKRAFPDKLLQIVNPTIFSRELEHVAATSRESSENITMIHPNVEKCLISLFRIGLVCSMESPHERMSGMDVIKELSLIRRNYFPSGENNRG